MAELIADISPFLRVTHAEDCVPATLDDLHIGEELVSGLVLRTLAAAGSLTGIELENRLGIPYETFQPIVEELVRMHLVEVSGYGSRGVLEGRPHRLNMNHLVSVAGRQRAAELAATQTNYLGPCPICLEDYIDLVRGQRRDTRFITAGAVRAALREVELPGEVVDQVGSAMVSGSAMFLHGAPGNGKSSIARSLVRLLGDSLELPYAVAVGDEVVRLLDPVFHHRVAGPEPADRRLRRVKRPLVRAGGELLLSQLELTYDERNRFYEAPLQWKANGGVLVIDDFGRQAEPPSRLLNRFIVPMEEEVDYLDLAATGHKVEVPFACQVVFSTNLAPRQLVDEAFLRRIPYKILVGDPSPDAYARIFRKECERAGLAFEGGALDHLFELYGDRPMRGSHPRELLGRLVDRARYLEERPRVTAAAIRQAFESYLNPGFGD